MRLLYSIFCGAVVLSALFADYRGWTTGAMLMGSSRRYESSLNHK